MFRSFSLALCFMLAAASVIAQNKEQGRLENAGLVMEEILNLPDSIPQDLLNKAECVIVVPSMTKVAIGIGGSYGRGAMVCRSGASFDGGWGSPAMYALDGGSFGLQLGSCDLVRRAVARLCRYAHPPAPPRTGCDRSQQNHGRRRLNNARNIMPRPREQPVVQVTFSVTRNRSVRQLR
jgi:hypothetical protein